MSKSMTDSFFSIFAHWWPADIFGSLKSPSSLLSSESLGLSDKKAPQNQRRKNYKTDHKHFDRHFFL